MLIKFPIGLAIVCLDVRSNDKGDQYYTEGENTEEKEVREHIF